MGKSGEQFLEMQELERAAERYYDSLTIENLRLAFKNGAKWQRERSYSDEEVLDILYKRDLYIFNRDESIDLELPEEWFEQFKKK